MGQSHSVNIDFSIKDIPLDNLFISFHAGYIDNIYYGNSNVNFEYSTEEIYIIVKNFLLEAQKENTSLKIIYTLRTKPDKSIKREIIILQHESQEPMTRGIIDNNNEGTAARIHIVKNYYYGVFYYNGKLICKIYFS